MFVKTRRRSIVDLDDDITWGTDHGRFNHSRMTSIIRLLRQVVQPYTCNISIGTLRMDPTIQHSCECNVVFFNTWCRCRRNVDFNLRVLLERQQSGIPGKVLFSQVDLSECQCREVPLQISSQVLLTSFLTPTATKEVSGL